MVTVARAVEVRLDSRGRGPWRVVVVIICSDNNFCIGYFLLFGSLTRSVFNLPVNYIGCPIGVTSN